MVFPFLVIVAALALMFASRWFPTDDFFLPGVTSSHGTKILSTAVWAISILSTLAAALYVILSAKYDDATSKWAYGAAGVVIGHIFPSRPK